MGRNHHDFEALHPRTGIGQFATKTTAEADGGLSALDVVTDVEDKTAADDESPYGRVLTDAELLDVARSRARARFGERAAVHGQSAMCWYAQSPDDLASEVMVVCMDARRRGVDITPAYVSVVTRRLASPLHNLAGRDRAALGKLASWRSQFESDNGRAPSQREVEEQAQHIRTTWPNPKDRPSRAFHQVSTIASMTYAGDSPFLMDRAHVVDASTSVVDPVDHAREDRLEDAIEQIAELSAPERLVARRTAWLRYADATGAPRPSARLSKNKVTAVGKVLAAHPDGVEGGVRQGMRDYSNGHDSAYARALVAPWETSTVDDRDAAVDVLAEHPQRAADLWASALACTSNRHRAAA